jgi:hypothetical protein
MTAHPARDGRLGFLGMLRSLLCQGDLTAMFGRFRFAFQGVTYCFSVLVWCHPQPPNRKMNKLIDYLVTIYGYWQRKYALLASKFLIFLK